MMRIAQSLLCAAVVTFLAATSFAQPLIERVPDDALVYIAWQGTDALGQQYEQSHLANMLRDTKLVERYVTMMQGFMERVPQEELSFQDAQDIWHVVLRRPAVVWVGGLTELEEADPRPRFEVIIDAGEDVEKLRVWIEKAQAESGEADVAFEEHDGIVTMRWKGVEPSAPAVSLAENERFTGVVGGLAEQPALIAYVDVQKLIQMIEQGVEAEQGPQDLETWLSIKQGLGIDGLDRIAYAGSFVGQNWQDSMVLLAPAPRRGLLAMFEGAPITDEELRIVPMQATWLRALRFDLARTLDMVVDIAVSVDADAQAGYNDAMAFAKEQTGVDLEQDLLANLGDLWIAYSDPTFAAPMAMGVGVGLVHTARDGEQLGEALLALQQWADEQLKESQAPVAFTTMELQDLEVHSLATPVFSPSWAIDGDRLYIAMAPQAITTLHAHAQPGEQSILDNEAFQQVREQLGNHPSISLMWADLPKTAMSYYQGYVMLMNMIPPQVKQQTGMDFSQLLPPYKTLAPHFAPAGSSVWTDDDGWHNRQITPWPGATVFSPEVSSTAPASMAVGIMLPAMGAARTSAKQAVAFSNLKQLGVAVYNYESDHDGQSPQNIADLAEYLGAKNRFRAAQALVSPGSDVDVPDEFNDWSDEDQKQWIRENSSYILLPLPEKIAEVMKPSERVLAFERPSHAEGNVVAVLYLDGHVERKTRAELHEFRQTLQEQADMTLEELIARQTGEDLESLPEHTADGAEDHHSPTQPAGPPPAPRR